MNNKRFYVYINRRKDNGVVFYVGKGTGDRYKRAKRYKEWNSVVTEAGGFIPEILKDSLLEKEALDLETELISSPEPDWQLVNKVKRFNKKKTSPEEILEMFSYDESSRSCLRYRKWNNSKIKKTAKYAGDEAGYLLNEKAPPAYFAVRLNGNSYLVHRLVWIMHNGEIPDDMVVNHKNGVSTDNRISNLEVISQAVNCRRTSKQAKENVGVRKMTVGAHSYAVCSWSENFVSKVKLFSYLEHGEEEATRLATEFRKAKINEMHHLGYKLIE